MYVSRPMLICIYSTDLCKTRAFVKAQNTQFESGLHSYSATLKNDWKTNSFTSVFKRVWYLSCDDGLNLVERFPPFTNLGGIVRDRTEPPPENQ